MTQDKIKTHLVALIREALLIKGYTISSWSREKGFSGRAVNTYIHRYAKEPRIPQSPEVYAILDAIHRDTGVNLMSEAS